MASTPRDPAELLAQVKAERQRLGWEPLAPERRQRFTADELPRTKEALDYLHRHWVLPDGSATGVGGGARGMLVRAAGRVVFRVLGPYLREERELLGHLVRLNDALVKQCDQLAERCQELADRAVDRQLAEAANLTDLAVWLDATLGTQSRGDQEETAPTEPESNGIARSRSPGRDDALRDRGSGAASR